MSKRQKIISEMENFYGEETVNIWLDNKRGVDRIPAKELENVFRENYVGSADTKYINDHVCDCDDDYEGDADYVDRDGNELFWNSEKNRYDVFKDLDYPYDDPIYDDWDDYESHVRSKYFWW